MEHSLVIEQLPGLRRYARALTGDAWAADDLVQDTLERACAKWQLWLAGSDLRAWLFTLMHNLYLNQRRHVQPTSKATPLEDIQSELRAPAEETDSALDLSRCLQRLPDDERLGARRVGGARTRCHPRPAARGRSACAAPAQPLFAMVALGRDGRVRGARFRPGVGRERPIRRGYRRCTGFAIGPAVRTPGRHRARR